MTFLTQHTVIKFLVERLLRYTGKVLIPPRTVILDAPHPRGRARVLNGDRELASLTLRAY
jgi:hypothetical protein